MVTMVDGSTDHRRPGQNGVVIGTTEVFDLHTNTYHMLQGMQKFPLYPRIQLTKQFEYLSVALGMQEHRTTPAGSATRAGGRSAQCADSHPPGSGHPKHRDLSGIYGTRTCS